MQQEHRAPGQQSHPDAFSNPDAYELFMGRWSARLAPSFAAFAGIRNGQHVLDVGCGTGSLSRILLAMGDGIRTAGVEPVEDYVSAARQKTPDARATFQAGTAEAIPFPGESFDAALALLVLQEFGDPVQALREMARVTRRGGTVAACLWDFANMAMSTLFWQAAEVTAPQSVARRRAQRKPYRIDLQGMNDLWTAAGLTQVRTAILEISQPFTSFDDYWQPFISGCTPLSAFAAALHQETNGKIAGELRRIIPGQRPDGSFTLPGRALAAAGIVGP
jgi:ubiquinone/menaquinone biosynthesis C-methylase UbiE